MNEINEPDEPVVITSWVLCFDQRFNYKNFCKLFSKILTKNSENLPEYLICFKNYADLIIGKISKSLYQIWKFSPFFVQNLWWEYLHKLKTSGENIFFCHRNSAEHPRYQMWLGR